MIIVKTSAEIQDIVTSLKRDGKRIGLIPTMGALHKGHISLMQLAKQQSQCDILIVSIFVNPTQFGPNEDLGRYPRTPDNDIAICEEQDVDIIFMPDVNQIYEQRNFLSFKIDVLNRYLCGTGRKGHFEGVLQIVLKLFNLTHPDFAFFGQKDIQQFLLISRMVKEFNVPVSLVMGETVRESDGLALSSRNRYLSQDERRIAPVFYQELTNIYTKLRPGFELNSLLEAASGQLREKKMKIDYINVVDYETLQPVTDVLNGEKYIIAGAVYLGNTRLIDNLIKTI